MKRRQLLVLGPPGCGKTTYLLDRVREEMENGVHPSRIAYVSFTKKAAHEGKQRALAKFNVAIEDFHFFSTLHSLAFRQLGLTKQQVMGMAHYRELGGALGLVFSSYMDFDEGMPLSAKNGDQILQIVGLAAATLQPLEQQFKDYHNGEVSWWQVLQFYETLQHYKKETGMLDFFDMLDRALTDCEPIDVDVAFIDEAQDLTKQQWRLIRHIFKRAKRVYIAGDDDQAIFRWAGADVDSFLNLHGEQIVLSQSYRLPQRVHALCGRISHRIERRFEKVWQPRAEAGDVQYLSMLEDIEWRDGSYLLLTRNKYLLERVESFMRSSARAYTIGERSSLKEKSVRAIIGWERLRRGTPQPATMVRDVYEFLSTGTGVARGGKKKLAAIDDAETLTIEMLREQFGLLRDDVWHDAFERLPDDEREFYRAILRRGGKISERPAVHLSTIHGVKGGEADHVVILSDMAARTFNEYRLLPDDEHRVAYVAASRARRSLSILLPQSLRAYDYR